MKICNFKNVYIKDAATVVGKLEGEGPLGSLFDMCESDSYFGKDSWEEAEAEMCGRAVGILLGKTGTDDSNVRQPALPQRIFRYRISDCTVPVRRRLRGCSSAARLFREGLRIMR